MKKLSEQNQENKKIRKLLERAQQQPFIIGDSEILNPRDVPAGVECDKCGAEMVFPDALRNEYIGHNNYSFVVCRFCGAEGKLESAEPRVVITMSQDT